MSKTINVELSKAGIEKAIKDLENYKKSIKEKANKLTERLAQLGATVASINFSRAAYEGDNDVVITVTGDGNYYTINANGESVCFIEFGTGVNAVHPKGSEYGFTPGSYSGTLGSNTFKEKGYWYYNNHKMTGDVPGKGMYEASKEIRKQLEQIAKEVFND